MPTSSRWVRLNVDWADTPWLAGLPQEARTLWPSLLCYVKLHGTRGKCRLIPIKRLAAIMDVDCGDLQELWDAGLEDGALRVTDVTLELTSWDHYQSDETAAERMRRHRSKLNLEAHTVEPVTRNATAVTAVTVTETETETVSPLLATLVPPRGTGRVIVWTPPSGEASVRAFQSDIAAYFREHGSNGEEARKFYDHHQAYGWKGRKGPIKDWKAACRTWISNSIEFAKRPTNLPDKARLAMQQAGF